MKKVTIDARMINASGIGTVIRNILKRIITKKKEWYFYILGNLKELEKQEFLKSDNVQLIECLAPIYSIKEQIELIKIIPKDTELMWSPHYNIPLLYHGKLIVTIHDVFHLAMPEFVEGVHKKIYARFMFEMVKRKASKIITVSYFTAKELQKYVGVSSNKISVIYNGIDEEWFNIQRGKPIYHKPYILYVGNVKPHKNLAVLIKAFLKIMEHTNYDLIIVGKKEGFITGDLKIKQLVDLAPERIVFTGFVEDDLLKQYYKQAEIFVFPSLYEGFGFPPLEALAAGCKRVLCSDVASIPEICGDNVEYFNPNDVDMLSFLLEKNNKQNFFLWDESVHMYEKHFDLL